MNSKCGSLQRREALTLLFSGVATGTVSMLIPASTVCAKALVKQAPHSFRFDLLLDQEKIGTHELLIEHTASADVWRHETTVDVSVSLGIFGDITFYHHSIEEWKNGRLVRLESETNDDGEKFSVVGRVEGDEFVTDGPDGRFRAAGRLLTTNDVWTESFCQQKEVIDSATGGVIGIVADPATGETTKAVTRQDLRPYDVVSAKITGQLLYNESGIWTGGTLQRNGQEIDYDQRR